MQGLRVAHGRHVAVAIAEEASSNFFALSPRATAARRRAQLRLYERYAYKPHVIIVVRVELDVEHIVFIGVAPV